MTDFYSNSPTRRTNDVFCLESCEGATPLHAASFNGQLGATLCLLDAGASATASDNDNLTALELAAEAGHEDLCVLLRAVGTVFFALH